MSRWSSSHFGSLTFFSDNLTYRLSHSDIRYNLHILYYHITYNLHVLFSLGKPRSHHCDYYRYTVHTRIRRTLLVLYFLFQIIFDKAISLIPEYQIPVTCNINYIIFFLPVVVE